VISNFIESPPAAIIMKRTKHQPLPEPVTRLRDQLSEFRATDPPRRRLPDSLWQAAAELAREHGVYAVAHPLQVATGSSQRRRVRCVFDGLHKLFLNPRTASTVKRKLP
jgi:hypothetical protein